MAPIFRVNQKVVSCWKKNRGAVGTIAKVVLKGKKRRYQIQWQTGDVSFRASRGIRVFRSNDALAHLEISQEASSESETEYDSSDNSSVSSDLDSSSNGSSVLENYGSQAGERVSRWVIKTADL
jgi:hypothetical protein